MVVEQRAHSVELVSDARAPGAAREFVRYALQQWRLDSVGDVATLLTSELVSNVVRHVDAPMKLRASCNPPKLRIEVDDPSTDLPVRQAPDPTRDHGRGILIVESLAAAWGVGLRDDGKTVWFEIEVETPTGTEPT